MEELGQGKKSGMSASSGRRVVTFLPPPVVVKPVLRSTAGEDVDGEGGVAIGIGMADAQGLGELSRTQTADGSPGATSTLKRPLEDYSTAALESAQKRTRTESTSTPGSGTPIKNDNNGGTEPSQPYPYLYPSPTRSGLSPLPYRHLPKPTPYPDHPTYQNQYRPPSPPTSDPVNIPLDADADVEVTMDVGAVARRYPGTRVLVRAVRFFSFLVSSDWNYLFLGGRAASVD